MELNHKPIENSIEFFSKLTKMHFIKTPEVILTDGNLHRCQSIGDIDGEQSIVYCYKEFPIPHGYLENYLIGTGRLDWMADMDFLDISEEQKKEFVNEIDLQRRQDRLELETLNRKNAIICQDIYTNRCVETDYRHPINTNNGLSTYSGAKIYPDNDLSLGGMNCFVCVTVPIFDKSGELVSLLFINEDGKQRYFYGTKTEETYAVIGNLIPTHRFFICANWITGCQLHAATGICAVVITRPMDLKSMLTFFQELCPDSEITVVLDHSKNPLIVVDVMRNQFSQMPNFKGVNLLEVKEMNFFQNQILENETNNNFNKKG